MFKLSRLDSLSLINLFYQILLFGSKVMNFQRVMQLFFYSEEVISWIEEDYFGNLEFENGNFEKQSGELKAKWGTKSKVGN
jgi:hypothetical protein